MKKWPQLDDWSLENLLRLRRSWQEIRCTTETETLSHAASMTELEELITQKKGETIQTS